MNRQNLYAELKAVEAESAALLAEVAG